MARLAQGGVRQGRAPLTSETRARRAACRTTRRQHAARAGGTFARCAARRCRRRYRRGFPGALTSAATNANAACDSARLRHRRLARCALVTKQRASEQHVGAARRRQQQAAVRERWLVPGAVPEGATRRRCDNATFGHGKRKRGRCACVLSPASVRLRRLADAGGAGGCQGRRGRWGRCRGRLSGG